MGTSISKIRFQEFTLEERGIVLTLEHIGEGLGGDFDPQDPKDVPVLRFRFEKRQNGILVEVDDASFSTMIPATTPHEALVRVARRLMDEAAEAILAGDHVRNLCQRLCWIDASGNLPVPAAGLRP